MLTSDEVGILLIQLSHESVENVEAALRRSAKVMAETRKEVRQTVDVEVDPPPQSLMPEILSEGDGFLQLCDT